MSTDSGWEGFRRTARDSISEPVYSTPNPPQSSLSPSSSALPTRSPQSSSNKSVSTADPSSNSLVTTPFGVSLERNHWDNLEAIVGTLLPSDPVAISRRLNELLKQEEDLEIQLTEIESRKKTLRDKRFQLIKQLEKVLSPQSIVSPNPVSALPSTPLLRPAETIIEQLEPESPSQLRSPNSNSSTFKKRPGPASKTGLKSINPGSLPPLGSISGSSKNSRKENGEASKRPVTTGVKQSRPQPMRARKRNKDTETESSVVPKSSIPVKDQTANDSQIPAQSQSSSQTQTQSKAHPPLHSPQLPKRSQTLARPATPRKSQSQTNSGAKDSIKTEPKTDEKPRIPINSPKSGSQNPGPFRERSDTGSSTNSEPIKKRIKQESKNKPKKSDANHIVSRDDDADPLRPNPIQTGSDDDSAHSDSDIFNVLRNVHANGESLDISMKKVKTEPQTVTATTVAAATAPVSVKVEPQDASRREPKIKQEK